MSIDLDSLDPLYRKIFADAKNGTPDNISKAGCLALSNLGAKAWNAWRKDFPALGGKTLHGFAVTSRYENFVNFRDHVFEKHMDFSLFNFGANAQFENAQFQQPASFDLAIFEDDANFELTKFEEGVRFQATKFEGDVSFKCAQFSNLAFFSYAQFGGCATFIGAKFSGQTNFNEVIFGKKLLFDHATFDCHVVSFLGGNWQSWSSLYPPEKVEEVKIWATAKGLRPGRICLASFDGVKFSGRADFSENEFVSKTRFSHSTEEGTVFWPERDDEGRVKPAGNGKVKELARFESKAGTPLVFGSSPIFHNCKFNQDITFDGAQFPKATGFEESARAYRTLKLAFAQQQAVRQEQQFFRLEMAEESRGVSWRQRYLYGAYGLLSEYGFSLWRPLMLLLSGWLLFAFMYGTLADMIVCLPFQTGCHISQKWVEFSLLQGLPISGFDSMGEKLHRDLFGHEVATTSVLVTVLFHKTISLLALFLAGLALRNLFKMK